jgi:aminoglycoside phosphotransferase family enzyme/predicted kinase
LSTRHEANQISEEDLVQFMLEPAAYPWQPDAVTQLETHMSRLFFAGDRVVKIKRPVRYGFVDHLTLDRRRQSCFDEVRLNRLLTDDIYLDAMPVSRVDGRLQVGGDGDPAEWATVMRRLPADAMLDHLLKTGRTPERLADRLADRLIPFHARSSTCPGDPGEQAAEAERILRENLDEIDALRTAAIFPREFSLIRSAVLAFLDRHPDAIRRRAEAGWIREGHGDLKCEHIVLDPPGALQVYDCVEFSIAIRCADVASDLAFLLLDLERLGEAETARELVEHYRIAGIDLPDDMLALYRTHRALVRVKVSALTVENATVTPELADFQTVAAWLHHAAASALSTRPVIIAMTGFSGSGKSVVARDISLALRAPVVSTDAIRRKEAVNAANRYAPDERLANYRRLIEQAREPLERGTPVVLDGAFLRDEERHLAAVLARDMGVPLLFVEVVADPTVVDRRIKARSRGESASFASEASREVMAAQRQQFALTPPARPGDALLVTIDTSADAPAALDPLFAVLSEQGLIAPAL